MAANQSSQAMRAVRDAALREIKLRAMADLRKAHAKGLRTATRMGVEISKDIAESFAKNFAENRQEVFQTLGERAQQAMLAAYDDSVVGKEGPASSTHYREGHGRLAGGVLRRALESSDFFKATGLGLEWGNKELLDAQAAHWNRLNSGTSPEGETSSREFTFSFGGKSGFLSSSDTPSHANYMPKGIFFSGGKVYAPISSRRGLDAFAPYRDGFVETRGNVGKHFMDEGLRVLADGIPEAIRDFQNQSLKGLSKVRKRRRASQVSGSGSGGIADVRIP